MAENPNKVPKTPSYAISDVNHTSMHEALKPLIKANPGKSGFRLLKTGNASFLARLALIQAAEKSLDLQYYAIHDDTTSNLLIEALVRAARRGVRVRFLLDNISVSEVDRTFSILNGLKNIEIRVFNPVGTKEDGMVGRMITKMTHLDGLNRRMHNKALIADNQMAIMGGRNLGDEYFEENTNVTFKDLDILTAGPITAEISKSFDNYWNSDDSVPIEELYASDAAPEQFAAIRSELSEHWQETMATPEGRKLLTTSLTDRLKEANIRLYWAKADLVADDPAKVTTDRDETRSYPYSRLQQMVDRGKSQFLAISPYFVPREEGVDWLAGLVERGMEVKVLTNSLAATDVVAVHTGYRRYREELLERGIKIYEFKPIGGERPKQRLLAKDAPATASLHSKVYVVDGKDVLIGSFNLDPRSIELNTEVALAIHSPELAAQVIRMFEDSIAPENSYELVLKDGRHLRWLATDEDGHDISYWYEPESGLFRQLQMNIFSLLPIEDQL